MYNAEILRDEIIEDIRDWFSKNGPKATAVIGISGGKDSTVAAALLVRALGSDRVLGVLMPNGEQPDISDSFRVAEALNIRYLNVNIESGYTALRNELKIAGMETRPDADVNLQPRLRMSVLYMVAQSLPNGGRVINTCNRSEDYVGYSTKYGDSAGDVSILGNLYVSEILAIGDTMPEIPSDLVHKAPSDGLWGDTDEMRFGFTYDELEQYIETGSSGDADKDAKIKRMHDTSRHKYTEMHYCSPLS